MKALKIIGVIVLLFIIIGAFTNESDTANNANTQEAGEESKEPEVNIATKVEAALGQFDDDMRQTLASTSQYGYQGDIEKVEADGEDGVKVHVSTHYDDSGDGEDGGKNIARKIFGAICLDVPELKTMYVTSTSSGLDSRSVYRSDFPACE